MADPKQNKYILYYLTSVFFVIIVVSALQFYGWAIPKKCKIETIADQNNAFKFFIDKIEPHRRRFFIEGWAIIPGSIVKSYSVNLYLVHDKSKNVYKIKSQMLGRHDVEKKMGIKRSLIPTSGFSASFLTTLLPSGMYSIFIELIQNGDRYISDSGITVNI